MNKNFDRKQITRERILREAACSIRLNGPNKVGVATLMANAGLTHGGFYAHFKSKDDLVTNALIYMFEERYESFCENMSAQAPAAALRTYIERYLSTNHRDNIDQGCPLAALSSDLYRLRDVQRKKLDFSISRQIDGFATVLEKLHIHDSHSQASSLVYEMVGALVLARAIFDTKHSDTILAGARIRLKQRFGVD